MPTRLLIASLALVALAASAQAKAKSNAADLSGAWTVTGSDLGKAKVTMTFTAPDQLTVTREEKSDGGESHSSTSGPTWTLKADKLTFDGSMNTNGFEVKGAWTLTWDGPDKLTVKTHAGKTYQLARVKDKS